MTVSEQVVISSDSHVLEPHDLWTSRMGSGPFADRAQMQKLVEPVMVSYAKEIGADTIYAKILAVK